MPSLKIEAATRLLSELSNQEKISVYTKKLAWETLQLSKLDRNKAPETYAMRTARAKRYKSRIQILKTRHNP